MRTSKDIRVIHPRKHYDIDLWFVFGGDKRPQTTPVLVSMATRGVSSSRKFSVCGATFVDTGVKLGDAIAQRAPSCQGSLPILEIIAPQKTILTIENTQISTGKSASDRYLQDLCIHAHGVPACAALSPNIDINRTFEAVTQKLAEQVGNISAPRGTRRSGGKSRAIFSTIGSQEYKTPAGCAHPECENPACVTKFAMVHRSDVNKTSPFYKAKNNMLLQHGRLGHLGERLLYSASKRGRVRGLALKSPKLVCNCISCNLCKGKRIHFKPICKSEAQIEYENKLETCTSDYIGPMRVQSHGGATGSYICTHLGAHSQSDKPKSRFCRVYLVKTKTQAPACLRAFQLLIKARFEKDCRHWRVDNASELKFGAMEQFRQQSGCFFTYSPPYTAIRNREAEKMNDILCMMALCIMVHGRAPAKFWGLALIYAGIIWNHIPSEGGKSPLEIISGVVPDVSMFRVFWCPCFPLHFKEEGRFKFELHSRGSPDHVCRFVGLSFDQPDCWLYFDPTRNVIGSSAHMRFDESAFGGSNLLWGSVTEQLS